MFSMFSFQTRISPLSKDALALGTFVFVLHLTFFFLLAALLEMNGGSMVHLIDRQDEQEFVSIAHSLIALGEFRISSGIELETFRTIGYPAFAAFILALTGGSWAALYTAHALVVGATAAATAWVAQRAGLPRRAALFAGLLLGVSPDMFLLTGSGMGSDKLFPLLFVIAVGCLLLFQRYSWWRVSLIIGFVLGLATLVRPIGILASLPVIGAIIIVPSARALPWATVRFAAALLALCTFVLVLLPWHARNYLVAGHFSLSSLPVYNFVYYNIPLFLAGTEGRNEIEERDRILAELGNPNLMTLRGFAYANELTAMQRTFLREHAREYTVFHVSRMVPFFLGSGFNVMHAIVAAEAPPLRLAIFPTERENLTAAILRGDTTAILRNIVHYPLVTLERLSWLTFFFLAFLSPLCARGMERRFLLVLCGLTLALSFLSSPVVQPRYRAPIEPLLFIAATVSLVSIKRRFSSFARSSRPRLDQKPV